MDAHINIVGAIAEILKGGMWRTRPGDKFESRRALRRLTNYSNHTLAHWFHLISAYETMTRGHTASCTQHRFSASMTDLAVFSSDHLASYLLPLQATAYGGRGAHPKYPWKIPLHPASFPLQSHPVR